MKFKVGVEGREVDTANFINEQCVGHLPKAHAAMKELLEIIMRRHEGEFSFGGEGADLKDYLLLADKKLKAKVGEKGEPQRWSYVLGFTQTPRACASADVTNVLMDPQDIELVSNVVTLIPIAAVELLESSGSPQDLELLRSQADPRNPLDIWWEI